MVGRLRDDERGVGGSARPPPTEEPAGRLVTVGRFTNSDHLPGAHPVGLRGLVALPGAAAEYHVDDAAGGP
jgi:hypothetical protein